VPWDPHPATCHGNKYTEITIKSQVAQINVISMLRKRKDTRFMPATCKIKL
jgi:hypothetical protein